MKREKRSTKKERKAARVTSPAVSEHPARAGGQEHEPHAHIHCIACGKHLDPSEFGEPDGAAFYRCQHGGDFPHCVACSALAKQMVDEHDLTGRPVRKAAMWH